MLSVVFVLCCLAMGVSAVIAGYAVVQGGGMTAIARDHGFMVMALAALAGGGMVLRRAGEGCSA